MKKIIFILIFISCFAVAFAETGYRGYKWEEEYSTFSAPDPIVYMESDKIWGQSRAEHLSMYGHLTTLFYHYIDEKLKAIAITTTTNDTAKIKESYRNLVKQVKVDNYTKSEFLTLLSYNGIMTGMYDKDLRINKYLGIQSYLFEQDGLEQLDSLSTENGKANIYVYNYNDDTRLYLYENYIQYLTIAVYVKHKIE